MASETYTPPHSVEELFSSTSEPRFTGKRLNQKTIAAVLGVLSVLLLWVVLGAFRPREKSTPKALPKSHEVVVTDKIQRLADNYDGIDRTIRRETDFSPNILPKSEVAKVTDYERYLERMRVERAKRATEAKNSDLSFSRIRSSLSNGTVSSKSDEQGVAESANLLNERDAANRQDEKGRFLDAQPASDTHLRRGLDRLRTPYEVQAGTIIPALLLTGINSDLPGLITAQVSLPVYDTPTGRFLLIPQGARAIGKYDSKITYGQERVLIVWNRLVFPNGTSIVLQNMPGVDLAGVSGVSDEVNNHWGRIFLGAVLGSTIGAGAQIATGSTDRIDPSYQALAAAGAAQNINSVGQEVTKKNLDIQPTLSIEPGFRINILVNKDMTLTPYN